MKGLSAPGGIRSYIGRVSRVQADQGHEVVFFDRRGHVSNTVGASRDAVVLSEDDADLAVQAVRQGLDVLHMHTPGEVSSDGPFAVVHTEHGHHAYCPSGTKYLARSNAPCRRTMSLVGCTIGHVADRCGSLRPTAHVAGYRRVEASRRAAARDLFITISEFGKERMVEAGYDTSRIQVLHNPAPVACEKGSFAQAPAGAKPMFLYIGRIVAEKGLATLIKAAARVKANVEFEIIGDGPQASSLVALSRAMGVADKFAWRGWIDDEEAITARLQKATALVFPSVWQEPAGLVISEAASAARPVIASNVGGIPEYARRLENTILVSPGDPAALADAMDHLAENPEISAQLGEAGWRNLREGIFHLSWHVKELEALYARLLGDRAGA